MLVYTNLKLDTIIEFQLCPYLLSAQNAVQTRKAYFGQDIRFCGMVNLVK